MLSGVNDDDDAKIKQFMNWHIGRVKKGRRDIPVKELRHIIPTFILRCFAMKEDQPTQKKGQCSLGTISVSLQTYNLVATVIIYGDIEETNA